MVIEYEQLVELLKILVPTVAVVATIRAELRNLKDDVNRIDSNAEKAHERLNHHIETFHGVKTK